MGTLTSCLVVTGSYYTIKDTAEAWNRRGEEMSELKSLRAEVKLLQAEKKRAEMEVSFLKKSKK